MERGAFESLENHKTEDNSSSGRHEWM